MVLGPLVSAARQTPAQSPGSAQRLTTSAERVPSLDSAVQRPGAVAESAALSPDSVWRRPAAVPALVPSFDSVAQQAGVAEAASVPSPAEAARLGWSAELRQPCLEARQAAMAARTAFAPEKSAR